MQTLHLCLRGVTRLLSPPPSPLHMLPSSHMGLLPNLTFQHTRCCLRAFACAVVDFAWFLSPPWIQPQPSKAWDGHTGSSRPPPLGPFSLSLFIFFRSLVTLRTLMMYLFVCLARPNTVPAPCICGAICGRVKGPVCRGPGSCPDHQTCGAGPQGP